MPSTTMVAVTSFAAPGRRVIREGQVLAGDDPLVSAHPSYFVPADVAAERQVEQATAAPGEKRTVSRARKTTTKKS